MSDHPVYACDSCSFVQYHPMSYCPRCPGRLRLQRKEIPHPPRFKDEAEIKAHLAKHGLDYHGEYPRFPKPEDQK